MTGRVPPDAWWRPQPPQDPQDFGRCVRLLNIAPAHWRQNIALVGAHFPAWKPLTDYWSDLEALYAQEVDSGSAPQLYARLTALLGKDAQ